MKLWLAYLLQNPQMAEDFAEDMVERHNRLLSLQNHAMLDDKLSREEKIDKALLLAHESHVYETLAKMIHIELRELQAQQARI